MANTPRKKNGKKGEADGHDEPNRTGLEARVRASLHRKKDELDTDSDLKTMMLEAHKADSRGWDWVLTFDRKEEGEDLVWDDPFRSTAIRILLGEGLELVTLELSKHSYIRVRAPEGLMKLEGGCRPHSRVV